MVELLGLAGTISGMVTAYFQRQADLKRGQLDLERLKIDNEHELRMREMDAQIIEKEYAARTNVAVIEAGSKADLNDTNLLIASMQSDTPVYSNGFAHTTFGKVAFECLDLIRGLIRPGLTAYISIAHGVISVIVIRSVLNEGSMNNYALAEQALGTLSYSMNACISHYFGTRNKASEAASRKAA